MTSEKDFLDLYALRTIFARCWSLETSTVWSAENPARGQCGVTALVVQDLFGGTIMKTQVDGKWHFYNLVGEMRVDLTREQFPRPPIYADLPATREDAFADTNMLQYENLSQAVSVALLREAEGDGVRHGD